MHAMQRFLLLNKTPSRSTQRPIDFLEQRIELLRHSIEQLRSARRRFADTIGSLSDATPLIDAAGRMVLANPVAATLFGAPDY